MQSPEEWIKEFEEQLSKLIVDTFTISQFEPDYRMLVYDLFKQGNSPEAAVSALLLNMVEVMSIEEDDNSASISQYIH